MWKRSKIDHIRVAVSRATETLILLDVDAKEKDNKHFKKILENNDVLTLSPEELLKYLDTDDHDLDSKIQMFWRLLGLLSMFVLSWHYSVRGKPPICWRAMDPWRIVVM